ncbi:MAG: asparagine synthase (glutamine-hydrolyzing) [Candidatus Omnitrophota bacterium]|nr:asparagine synthase (glutamine-hydrolyzing) [Candidatus Omnitrophota bacterium]
MCGICGIIDYNGNTIDKELINKMNSLMVHRGPDDEGIYISKQRLKPSVGLGHRRLKIIELSESGHQPMSNEDETVWIVFNGEIYNYHDLRVELENKGHNYKSRSDTETIVHLYEEYGADCVRHLRGMFSFAIWDKKKDILLLARDRTGKKPLLYTHKNDIFCFASEFMPLLASGLVKREVNYAAINYYLTFGYIPAPLTIYNNVFKLLPAHVLILRNNKINIENYWQLDYSKKIKLSEQDAIDETLRLLEESVKIRLHSDVPLGAFLSGGIDSSTIVALMSKLSSKKVKTFSIGFEEDDYNELKYAKNIAKRFDTEHNEFIVRPKALEILPLLVERFGEPFADSSCIPTYYVSQQTKKHVTVALGGDGGDELFAGYERYQAMILAETYQRMPLITKRLIRSLTTILPDSLNQRNGLRRAKRFLDAAAMPFQKRYLKWVCIFDDKLKQEICDDKFSQLVDEAGPLNFIESFLSCRNSTSLIDSLLFTDTMTYLPNDLLVKVDIASMANSLESRSPFLDHILMEFVAKLAPEYKLKARVKKYILKKAVKNLIPKENIHRRKMGFGVPIGKWFRGELKSFLSQTLLSRASLSRGYFKSDKIKNMVNQHIDGQKDYASQLWTILMLELWHQRFLP